MVETVGKVDGTILGLLVKEEEGIEVGIFGFLDGVVVGIKARVSGGGKVATGSAME